MVIGNRVMSSSLSKEEFIQKVKKEEEILDSFFKTAAVIEKVTNDKEKVIHLFAETAVKLYEEK